MAHIENADLGVWNATAVAGLGVGLVPRQICHLAVAENAEMHCAHFRSPGGVYLKCLCKRVCVFWIILGVLAMCMFGAFTKQCLLNKCVLFYVFFLCVWHLCLAQAFFVTPDRAPVSCAGVFVQRACGNRMNIWSADVFCNRMCGTEHMFLASIFLNCGGNQNHIFAVPRSSYC